MRTGNLKSRQLSAGNDEEYETTSITIEVHITSLNSHFGWY